MIYFKVILTFSQHITYLWLRFWDRRWHRFRVPGALLHVGVGDFRDGPAAVNVLEGPFQVQDVDLVFEGDRPMPSSLKFRASHGVVQNKLMIALHSPEPCCWRDREGEGDATEGEGRRGGVAGSQTV